MKGDAAPGGGIRGFGAETLSLPKLFLFFLQPWSGTPHSPSIQSDQCISSPLEVMVWVKRGQLLQGTPSMTESFGKPPHVGSGGDEQEQPSGDTFPCKTHVGGWGISTSYRQQALPFLDVTLKPRICFRPSTPEFHFAASKPQTFVAHPPLKAFY